MIDYHVFVNGKYFTRMAFLYIRMRIITSYELSLLQKVNLAQTSGIRFFFKKGVV